MFDASRLLLFLSAAVILAVTPASLVPELTDRSRYRGVIRPPSLSCSDAAVRGKRVDQASRYL